MRMTAAIADGLVRLSGLRCALYVFAAPQAVG
jgi:hypothetical protein